MQYKYANFGRLFAMVFLMQMLTPHMTDSKPVPGRKGAIGGMALSGIAGMAIGHAVSNHLAHRQQQKDQVPNGCYKQTLREPDPQDPRKFIETERLVCPSAVAPLSIPAPQPVMPVQYVQNHQIAQHQPIEMQHQAVPPQYMHPGIYTHQQQQQQQIFVPQQQQQPEQQQHFVPQQPQQSQAMTPADSIGKGIDDSLLHIQRPGDQQETSQQQQEHHITSNAQQQPEQPAQPFVPQQPPQPIDSAAHPPAQQPTQSISMQPGAVQQTVAGGPSVQYVQHPIQPAQSVQPVQSVQTVHPAQPNQPGQTAQDNSQVIILSKKTGYYGGKSSSEKVLPTNLLLMLTMAFLLRWFH